MTYYTTNGKRNWNLHNNEYRQMAVEKRNNCKKHLPHKVGHKGKNKKNKKILNIPNSEIMALFFCEVSPEKSIFTGTFITWKVVVLRRNNPIVQGIIGIRKNDCLSLPKKAVSLNGRCYFIAWIITARSIQCLSKQNFRFYQFNCPDFQ